MAGKTQGRLLSVLNGKSCAPPPIWLMRQAGRYLPEYKKARGRAGSFWRLCINPEMAADVTLQPVRRFDLDAAIIFSDILVVPYALGKRVEFKDGSGPRVETTRSPAELCTDVEKWRERMGFVYEAIARVAGELDDRQNLIGFAGGPWTLASYMIQGQGSQDQAGSKLWAYRDKESFRELLWIIAGCVAAHLSAQIEAGASIVQLFDSWAGGLNEFLFREYVIAPSRYIVEQVRKSAPSARIIGFPRGATQQGYLEYQEVTRVDAISLDTAVSLRWAVDNLGSKVAIQGNLDPFVLVSGGRALVESVGHLLAETKAARHIVNLGHGVLPETPVENVAELVRLVRLSA